MAWRIEFHPDAAKELRRLDRSTAARILKTLEKRIAALDDPRMLGTALKGEHDGYWRWRIGDYRVIARIEDERITILVVRVGTGARCTAEDGSSAIIAATARRAHGVACLNLPIPPFPGVPRRGDSRERWAPG